MSTTTHEFNSIDLNDSFNSSNSELDKIIKQIY